jgi:DNA-binding SARP family transcriptional activator/ABC-type glycerol-3-phosphate transport system substrate-binding protein
MRFRILGPLEVDGQDGPIVLGGPRQRLVLANLLVRPNQVVQADVLVDLVWGEDVPSSVRNTLQSYVSRLRAALGQDRLEGRAGGYTLRADAGEIDATLFESLLQEARAADGHPERVSQILGDALALWRGPAFADLPSDGLAGEVARLEELRILATEDRIAADLELGRHAALVGELEALTRTWPLRERLWGQLMLALYRANRQADALAAFARAQRLLADELGVDPSAELQRVHGRILRHDPELDVQGQPLRGYRLLEKLGEGAFGEVYRAIQPQVGREVAVKVVHPELANQPDFVRRFEREAQLVARLEHPHVVPLYDYWREPDGAYLIMRYLRGGSVEDLLERGPVEVGRASAILEQVAAALSAAHRQGVVHRDVKPGNVLLDEENNAYLTDFGVALDAGAPEQTSGTMVRGTPAYLSPEQIRLEPATPRSDIYALGVVLYELLSGGHPFPDSSLTELFDRHLHRPLPSVREMRPELPPAVDAVIARATSKDPSIRYGDAMEMAAAFRTATEDGAHVAAQGAIRNPFKGLRTFLEADAGDFFGREALVRRLVERLAEPYASARFLCVVGPSGSGKSSVVRAGIVPALRRGAIEGSDRWYVVDVMPGSHPFRELESALLGVAVEPPASLLDDLERDELGLVHAVERILPDPEAELLIVLDQLEEVFTLADEDERARFLGAIVAAVGMHGSRVRVIATLRADFFDRPLSVRGFGNLLAARADAITPMSPEELERAISGPAERVGLEIEPGLVAAMVTDVVDRPGALPLLQYALTELAERATDGRLAIDGYREIGAVSGALARRAEQLFERLNEAGRDACRQLFLRLVTLGEGTEDTRRRVRRSQLRSLSEERSMDGVIETFGRHRLLSFDRDADTREPTVDIAHEALIREWARFRTWVEDAREQLRLSAKISASAAEWVQSERSSEFLLAGTRLAQAEEATQSDAIRLTESEREYVDASLARRHADAEVERERHARELRLERRARTRLRSLVAVLAIGALLAASLAVVSVDRSREAERRRDESTIAGLTGGALSNLNVDPELSLLLALYAVDASASLDRTVPAETVDALHLAMQEAGVEYPVEDGPTAVRAGPLGIRGVFDLPLSELAEAARAGVDRSLTPRECDRFLGATTCPPLPSTFPADLRTEPVAPMPTPGEQPLIGTQVTFFGGHDDVEVEALRKEFGAFTAETGIEVRLTGNPAFADYVADTIAAGDPPDIAVLPQPGALRDFAREGHLIDLGTYVDIEALKKDQSPYLVSLGTLADDGSWPASDGTTFGAFVGLDVKSLIWYPVPELRAAGHQIPQTWDDLIALSDRLVDEGQTPWCLGWGSGTATGWPGTDWIENLLLMGAGPQVYDRWTFHQLPFDSPPVRNAFERLGEILFSKGYLPHGAVRTWFSDAQLPMFEDPPGCWLYQFPSFATGFMPQGTFGATDVFPFPSVEDRFPGLIGGGNMIAVFSDRPEVRELVRYILGPTYGVAPARTGLFISANRRFDLGNYEPFMRHQAKLIDAALAADVFRFDGSDLMPPPIGAPDEIEDVGLFWDAMMRYATEGPESLDAILAELDAAWPGG